MYETSTVGRPRSATSALKICTTRLPGSGVSGSSAKHSGVRSCAIDGTRKLRPVPGAPVTKSIDRRSSVRVGSVMGARAPPRVSGVAGGPPWVWLRPKEVSLVLAGPASGGQISG